MAGNGDTLLTALENKPGGLDENTLENEKSIRVRHGSKKKTKEKVATKTKTPKPTKPRTKLMNMSEDDFLPEHRHSTKKPKPSSFPFTSSEETIPPKSKPPRKKSSEDSENQPPSVRKSSKKGKSDKKKAKILKMLVSFSSSEDELSPELRTENVTPRTLQKSTPVGRKEVRTTRNTPLRNLKDTEENTSPEIEVIQTRTPSQNTPIQKPTSKPGRLYPDLDELLESGNNPPEKSKPDSPAVHQMVEDSDQILDNLPPLERLYPSLDELKKKVKARISIGAKGHETIIHSPKHVKICRLSTNSNISTIDVPIAESTAFVDMEHSPSDSYLARPVFQALTEPGSQKSTTPSSGKSTQPLTSQDLALELTVTQPDSVPATKSSSNSVPSSEYRGRSELTQVAWRDSKKDSTSDEEACKTVVSETTSEAKSSLDRQPNMSGPQVIEESSLSSKAKDSSSSLFSTRNQETTSTEPSIGSLNLSSYIKGKKKPKKKSVKDRLITLVVSSDDEPIDKHALFEESKLMMESLGDESELPFPLTQNHRGYVPDSQYSEDMVSPSRNVFDDVRVSETDSSTKVVPDSECNYVPESQSVEVVKDSQETVDTRYDCVPDSEALSSPSPGYSTQPTQDTVIRVPGKDESSIDNATTMFIKARSRYISVNEPSSPQPPRIQTPKSVKSGTKSAKKISTPQVTEESQNLSQVVSATKRSARKNIPMELIESLDDPEDLQATIELLSQKLETILSAKKGPSLKSSQNLSSQNRGDGSGSSIGLKQRNFESVSESPESPHRSFSELCVKKTGNIEGPENHANISLQCSLPTAPQGSVAMEDTVADTEIVEDTEVDTEEVLSPAQSEKAVCNVSLQCSMQSSPLTDIITEDELDKEENNDNALYRTAHAEDLEALEEQEYLTDDESFEEKKAAQTPSPPFHLKNAMSVERVKTILSDSKLRRRSAQVQGSRKVLSLKSPSNEDIQDEDEDEEEELPECPKTQRATVTSWRTAPESCPSPEPAARPSESSDEDDVESFFSKMRAPATPRKEPIMSLNDFIVEDEVMSEDEEENEEDEVFHVRTDNAQKPQKQPFSMDLSSDDDFNDTAFTSDEDDVFEEDDKQQRPTNSPLFKTPSLPPLRKKAAVSAPRAAPSSRVTATASASDLPASTPVRPPPRVLPNTTGHAPARQATFLRSLGPVTGDGEPRHPDAVKYVTNFNKHKEELSDRLFHLYNSTVFESKLPEDMEIKWNSRLLKTAGFCAYKRSTATQANRRVRIELSVKVCDSSERVRDTLIHEMCHAAVWIIHGVNDGHGAYWKHWAHKANRIHPDLPVIKRCHSYSIQTKYIYKCTSCGYELGRHSKSLNTDTKVCGYCRSPFQLLVNSKQGKRKTPPTPVTPRTPNRFALFVKENYKTLKEQNQASNHKEVMALLSGEFAKTKVSN